VHRADQRIDLAMAAALHEGIDVGAVLSPEIG
jgi:hypothetical protein